MLASSADGFGCARVISSCRTHFVILISTSISRTSYTTFSIFQLYRAPTLATMALSLSLLGIGDDSGHNQFGPASDLSRNYSGIISKICMEVARYLKWITKKVEEHFITSSILEECSFLLFSSLISFSSLHLLIFFRKILDPRESMDDSNQLGPFEASGLAFAMVMSNLYDLKFDGISNIGGDILNNLVGSFPILPRLFILPLLLREACRELDMANLNHSGWVRFYLYQTLYCCDVEKPECEEELKRVSTNFIILWSPAYSLFSIFSRASQSNFSSLFISTGWSLFYSTGNHR